MTFKVRRVTSGLLPQQHVPEQRGTNPFGSFELSRPEKSDDGDGKSTYSTQMPKINGSACNTKLDFDLTTTVHDKIRNNSLKQTNALLPTSTTIGSSQMEPSQQTRPPFMGKSVSITDADFMKQNKLILDDNVFSPQSAAGRRTASKRFLDRTTDADDLEFDPSDRDLPEKVLSSVGGNRIKEYRKDLQSLPLVARQKSPPKARLRSHEEHSITANTVKRSSPLRQVVLRDSANTTAEEAVIAISESSALRPRTTKEIFDQINSSIEQFRVSDYEVLGHYPQLDSSHESDEDILKSLDSLLPSRKQRDKDTDSVDETPGRSPAQKSASKQPESNVLELGSPGQNRTLKMKKSRACKNARDTLGRSSRHKVSSYKAWSAEKWNMLAALVRLTVPNQVIIYSKIVQKKLGCENKEELSLRVQFLVKQMRRQ